MNMVSAEAQSLAKIKMITPGSVWVSHDKEVYQAVGVSKSTSKPDDFVVVMSDKHGELHHQDLQEFIGRVDHEGRSAERFSFVGKIFHRP